MNVAIIMEGAITSALIPWVVTSAVAKMVMSLLVMENHAKVVSGHFRLTDYVTLYLFIRC